MRSSDSALFSGSGQSPVVKPWASSGPKELWTVGAASVICLLFMAVLLAPHLDRAIRGANDFAPLYTGAHLLGTDDLYNHERLIESSALLTGMASPDQGYIRLPFHAALLWPLSQLPYPRAYLLWESLSLACVIAFAILWRSPARSSILLFTCLSLPAFTALLNGQDSTFLLLFLAGSALLLERSRPFAAGLLWSLCAIKFHLFLLTPIFILARKEWRFAQGFLTGGATLAAISFAAAGWNWPREFLASAMNPSFSPGLERTATLHGILSFMAGGPFLEIAANVLVIAMVWLACRHLELRLALAAVLAGGVLVGIHAYLPDLSLLLPAGLAAISLGRSAVVRGAGLALLIPPIHLALLSGFPYSALPVLAMLTLVCGLGWEAYRSAMIHDERAVELASAARES